MFNPHCDNVPDLKKLWAQKNRNPLVLPKC